MNQPMKTKKLFLLSALIAGLGLILAGRVTAQNFTVLHSFTATFAGKNGQYPHDLVLSGSTLYGTAQIGGSSGSGTVFAINTDGTGFTILHSFTALAFVVSTNGVYCCTNSDGAYLEAGLILSGNILYGTAHYGGN